MIDKKGAFDAAKELGADFNRPGAVALFDAALDLLIADAKADSAATVVVQPVVQPVVIATTSDVPAMISAKLLALVCSPRPIEQLETWVGPLQEACRKFGMTRIRRVAAFIGQMAHESDLKPRTENLNYSSTGLIKTFGTHRISVADADRYGRTAQHPANQQAIANIVYGGSYGLTNLGNTLPGDGWLCRGAGPLQVTGRRNFEGFAKAMGMSFDAALSYARTLVGGIMAAAWFWEANDINRLADTPGVTDETKRINGGTNGLASRELKFNTLVDAMLKIEGGQPL